MVSMKGAHENPNSLKSDGRDRNSKRVMEIRPPENLRPKKETSFVRKIDKANQVFALIVSQHLLQKPR